MATLTFNNRNVRRVPINRNSLFYDAESYDFELEVGKDFVEQDMGQTVVLYQVDASSTNVDDVYGETKPNGVSFKTPVEIPCVYRLEEPELKSYDKEKQLGIYMKSGKLTVSIYHETLKELDVEVDKGDYIGVQVTPTHMEFFVVNSINLGNDNKHSLWGTVPLWMTLTCSHVDQAEFKG